MDLDERIWFVHPQHPKENAGGDTMGMKRKI
jgi:hypothetical protein